MKKKDLKKIIILIVLLLSYTYTTFINTESKRMKSQLKKEKQKM